MVWIQRHRSGAMLFILPYKFIVVFIDVNNYSCVQIGFISVYNSHVYTPVATSESYYFIWRRSNLDKAPINACVLQYSSII